MTSLGRLVALSLVVVAARPARAEDKPARLFTEGDADDEAATTKKVNAELALAKAGKPRTIVLEAATTDNWGCECAPFVYVPFAMSAPNDKVAFFYPLVAKGVDPAAFSLVASSAATYLFTGHFTKDRMTLAEWQRKRKQKPSKPSPEATEGSKLKQPVFAVDSWCLLLTRSDSESAKAYSDVLAKMKQAGVATCK